MGSLWGGEGEDGEGGEWCEVVEVGVWKRVGFVVERGGGGGEGALGVGFELVVVCLYCCFCCCIVIVVGVFGLVIVGYVVGVAVFVVVLCCYSIVV